MKILAKMKRGSISGRTVRILGVLLFATLATGCYDSGYYGSPGYYGNSGYYGSPGYYGSSGYYASPGYGGNTYYSKNVYRGYGSYPQPGLFGGYAPAHEAWDDSSRGRTSYSSIKHGGGESGEHGSARSSGHSGSESRTHGGTAGAELDTDSGHSH